MGQQGSEIGLGGPSGKIIRRELDKLLLKDDLRLSDRNRRFLAFIVSETLGGRAERIKAYSIAVDVFGRGEDFDPTVDPIVRIEATRIRAALASYYAGSGAGDSIRIDMPPGNYVPTFAWGPAAFTGVGDVDPPERPTGRSSTPGVVRLLVTHCSDPRDRCASARGELLIGALVERLSTAGFDVALITRAERHASEKVIKRLFETSRSAYALDVTVHTLAEAKRYGWRLTDLWNRRIGCSGSCDCPIDAHPTGEMIDGLAERVAEAVSAVAR
jgi:hypothetical protein